MSQAILVLGATSGIGGAMLRVLAGEGFDLILGGRDAAELERRAADVEVRFGIRTRCLPFDAHDLDSHAALVQSCFQNSDVEVAGVVLAHGAMTEGPPGETDSEATRRMIEVNYVASVSILEACAREFEARGTGWICAVSSVAGDRGRPSNYLYGSSKAALSAYLQGLRARLARSGIGVLDVKPGFVDTGLTWGKPGLFLIASPDNVARDAWRGIRKNRAVVYTPWFWRYIMLVIRLLPDRIFKRLSL